MKFWDIIGEICMFRWLFGKVEAINDNFNDREPSRYNSNRSSRNSYFNNEYGRNNQSYDDFHEEQDDYDIMDDF